MMIRHFKHHNIDKKKYDDCILQSSQGTVYAMSWYLDVVSPGWELLATDDFETIMPIPVKQKFGITYAIQPHLCQQLGIFSSRDLDESILKNFIKQIPYSIYRIQLNSGNIFQDQTILLRHNYVLDMSLPYTNLQERYKTNCQRNIKKAKTEIQNVSNFTSREAFFEILHTHNGPIIKLLDLLKKLLDSAEKYAKTEIWNVRDHSGNLLACTFFLYWKNRVYYMVPVSSPEGKKLQSMSFLIDQFIQRHSSTDLILDFEGSSILNIARFYEGFGANLERYPVINKDNFLTKIYSSIRV